MVNLPRPSLLSNPPGVEGLPARGSQQTPESAPTCFYRFRSSGLSQELEATDDLTLNKTSHRILRLCQLLAVPSLFGQGAGQSWTYSAEHYPILLQWKQQTVPAILEEVAQLLAQLHPHNDSDKYPDASLDLVLGHVICTVARYLPPTAPPLSPSDHLTSSSGALADEAWISESTQIKARDVLLDIKSQHPTKTAQAAKALLVDYVKPIFREVASSSSSGAESTVDPETGRKKPPTPGSAFIPHLDANLGRHRFQSAAEDNDASNVAPRKFSLHLTAGATDHALAGLDEGAAATSLVERNEALGCVNVLAWCLENMQLRTEAEWSEMWPMLVPPLLTLLEHHEPRFRVRGSMLVHTLLLRTSIAGEAEDASEVRIREVTLGKLLLRTGIGSLLERALHVNLTYIHDEKYAAALLSYSIGSLRQLILITTHPIVYLRSDGSHSPLVAGTKLDTADDLGKRRMEALFRLVSESILSTWSYLPIPPHSTQLGRQLVSVTCSAYLLLADDLSPPTINAGGGKGGVGGMARFIDVTIDWIFRSFVPTVSFTHTQHIPLTIQTVQVASRILFSNLAEDDDSQQLSLATTTTRRFTNMILSAVAKCWISAVESPLRTSATKTEGSAQERWDELKQCLAAFLVNLSRLDPATESRWTELVKIDSRLAALHPTSL